MIILITILLLGGVVLLMMLGILPGFQKPPIVVPGPDPITLEFWNVFEEEEVYSELIADYREIYPHITINYTKVSIIEYSEKLRDSFANSTDPDIFVIHNTWLPLERKRISPAPSTLSSVINFDTIYPDVVAFDFTREIEIEEEEGVEGGSKRVIYALPLAIETLGLFYNKDYFETMNITSPPKTWEELLDYVKLFTQFDDEGMIDISGIALGTADNVNRSVDIVSLLMMQGGARMNNELLTEATFHEQVLVGEGEKRTLFKPGEDALEFYLAFSDNTLPVYAWDQSMPYSIDAFVEGKTAMMINYPHHISTVISKAPHLNFGTAPVPQLKDGSEDVNYASYWGLTVSKNLTGLEADAAWRFIDFLTQPDNLKKYLTTANLPTARRDLIVWQQQDAQLRPFANQILYARSWYQADSSDVDGIFENMIRSAQVGERTIQEVLEDAAAGVTVLIQKIEE